MVPGTLLVTQLLFYSTTGAHGQLGQMVYLLKYCWDGGSEQDLKQLSMTFSNKYVSAFLLSLDPLLTIYFMTIIGPLPLFFVVAVTPSVCYGRCFLEKPSTSQLTYKRIYLFFRINKRRIYLKKCHRGSKTAQLPNIYDFDNNYVGRLFG